MNKEKKYYKIIYIVIILILILAVIIMGITIYNQEMDIRNKLRDERYDYMVSKYGIEYSTYSEDSDYEKILQECGKYKIIDNYNDYCNYLSKIKNYENYFHGKIEMTGSINKVNANIGTKSFFDTRNILLFKVAKDKIYNLNDMKIANISYQDQQMKIEILGTYSDYSRVNAETGYIFMIPIDKKITTVKIDTKWTSTKEIK